jgi:hypothetical protein
MIMKRPKLITQIFIIAFVLGAVLMSSSCVNSTGIGIGVGAPTVWGGGGGTGPPVFVGGPG